MDLLKTLLGNPVAELVKGVGGIVDNFHTSDAEKLEAQRKLTELQLGFQAKLLENTAQVAETQASVIRAEAGSASWLARSWRPILMLTFTYIVAHNYVIGPMFSLTTLEIPTDMWELLKLGIGGYVLGRSAEKVAVAVAKKK